MRNQTKWRSKSQVAYAKLFANTYLQRQEIPWNATSKLSFFCLFVCTISNRIEFSRSPELHQLACTRLVFSNPWSDLFYCELLFILLFEPHLSNEKPLDGCVTSWIPLHTFGWTTPEQRNTTEWLRDVSRIIPPISAVFCVLSSFSCLPSLSIS